MNRILVFSQSGRDVSLPSADSGFAARRHKEPARRGRYPKTAAANGCARGTNLKFQIGDFREGEMPGVLCRCKHMISRRLGLFSTFFSLFLSQKDLISRELQRKQGIKNVELFRAKEAKEGVFRRDAGATPKRRRVTLDPPSLKPWRTRCGVPKRRMAALQTR
jgi:hypothetical protein